MKMSLTEWAGLNGLSFDAFQENLAVTLATLCYVEQAAQNAKGSRFKLQLGEALKMEVIVIQVNDNGEAIQ